VTPPSGGSAGRSLDDRQRLIDLLELGESVCGDPEYGAERIGRQLADRCADADVVSAFFGAGVDDDEQIEFVSALVLEVVQSSVVAAARGVVAAGTGLALQLTGTNGSWWALCRLDSTSPVTRRYPTQPVSSNMCSDGSWASRPNLA